MWLFVLMFAALTDAVQAPASAADTGGREVFYDEFARALSRDDRALISAWMQYPLVVYAGGVRIPVADAAALNASWDVIFTPAFREAFARGDYLARVGLVEATPSGKGFAITRLTVPLEGGARSSGAASGTPAKPASRAAASAPRRIVFRAGQQTAQYSGTLESGGIDHFIVFVPQARTLDVRVDRVPGRAVVARVLDAKSGAALNAQAQVGARRWVGPVPAAADYRIELVRAPESTGPVLSYTLVVTLR